MGKKAVVLGGGGAKGAYEIGVMEALIKLDFDYDIVTGTSVGSLNGALFAQRDLKLAKRMWQEIDTAKVLDIGEIPPDQVSYRELGKLLIESKGLSYQHLEDLLRQVISEEKIRNSDIAFGLVTVQYPTMKPVELFADEMENGKLIDYLLASAACFPAMKSHKIDGKKYIDGGYYDNIPVDLAISRGAGEIVAVDLESVGVVRKRKHRPDVKIVTVKSEWPLGSMLIFDREQSQLNMKQGYIDTLKAFGNCEGKRFAFRTGESEKLFRKLYPYMENCEEEFFSDISNPLLRMARTAANKLYQKRWHSTKKLSREEKLMAVTEGLMEIMELDRYGQYTFFKMAKDLEKSFQETDAAAAAQLEQAIADIKRTKQFIENTETLSKLIGSLNRRAVVKYLVQILEKYRETNSEQGILLLFYLCVPLETTSAMLYLALTDQMNNSFWHRLHLNKNK